MKGQKGLAGEKGGRKKGQKAVNSRDRGDKGTRVPRCLRGTETKSSNLQPQK